MGLLIVLIAIQFIRPSKNHSDVLISENDISYTYAITEDVHSIFINKCYDCHSNTTRYPWYNNIQPIAWWLSSHVKEGKDELNFSEFKSYTEKRAIHKLEEISEAVNDGWMPLKSYLWMHHDAKITESDRTAINTWLKGLPVQFEKH